MIDTGEVTPFGVFLQMCVRSCHSGQLSQHVSNGEEPARPGSRSAGLLHAILELGLPKLGPHRT